MDYFAAMRAFVRAVELGSFSKAAAEAGIKVSTVSRYVTFLEEDLGAALFNRSTRHSHLTEAGKIFYDKATTIIAGLDEARSETSSLNAQPQGLLRINIPSTFGRRHVMPHMKDFLTENPNIRLDATLTDETVDLIDSGADIAVRIGALVDSSLIAKRLASHRRVLVASKDYLRDRPAIHDPQDLPSHECLTFALQPTSSWYYREPGAPPGEMQEIPVGGHLRANNSETLRDCVLSGLGLALLPTWLVGEDLRADRLVALFPELEWLMATGPERAIWAVYPPKRIVSPKVKVFMSFLEQRFGHPPYWDR
ncbi:MAG TPA: LysR family transcriptional regulator [Rhizomicrobium sp.]|jgi:DNA-binding transcriptional LysR family regulator